MVLEETKPLSKARVGKGENRVAFPQDYIVLDLETTGLSSDRDEIIEVSALKVHCGKDSLIDMKRSYIHFKRFLLLFPILPASRMIWF